MCAAIACISSECGKRKIDKAGKRLMYLKRDFSNRLKVTGIVKHCGHCMWYLIANVYHRCVPAFVCFSCFVNIRQWTRRMNYSPLFIFCSLLLLLLLLLQCTLKRGSQFVNKAPIYIYTGNVASSIELNKMYPKCVAAAAAAAINTKQKCSSKTDATKTDEQ